MGLKSDVRHFRGGPLMDNDLQFLAENGRFLEFNEPANAEFRFGFVDLQRVANLKIGEIRKFKQRTTRR